MGFEAFSQNLRRLRRLAGLTRKALADRAGVAPPAGRAAELSGAEPETVFVKAVAEALGVNVEVLFDPRRELRLVRFRSAGALRGRGQILFKAAKALDDLNHLASLLGRPVPFALGGLKRPGGVMAGFAGLCRNSLGTGGPIPDLGGLLIKAGVKVLPLTVTSVGFLGLSVAEADGGPAVVVNDWAPIPVERRLFSAVRELGHLLLHPEAYDVLKRREDSKEEKEADLFASHFLMPNVAFKRRWIDAEGECLIDRVFSIKRIFRVGYQTVLTRLNELGLANESIWIKFAYDYQKRFRKKLPFKEAPTGVGSSEPFGLSPFDFRAGQLSRLVKLALDRDLITVSRGAELLGVGLPEMRERMEGWNLGR